MGDFGTHVKSLGYCVFAMEVICMADLFLTNLVVSSSLCLYIEHLVLRFLNADENRTQLMRLKPLVAVIYSQSFTKTARMD